MPFSSMEAIFARDSMRSPPSRRIRPPHWYAFSMTMPAPATDAPESFTSFRSAIRALPFARKSSMMRTRSSAVRKSFDRRML